MNTQIKGTITSVFGNDINTDDIIPAWTLQESTKKSFFAKYAFTNYDPQFVKRCQKSKNNIIVAAKNFACGSSREQAVYALKENNVKAVICQSAPDIFYRNCLNNGLVLAVVKNISAFKLGKKVIIDLLEKVVRCQGKKYPLLISKSDAKTFILGGKIVKVQHHLQSLLAKKSVKIDYLKTQIKAQKPQTIVEKIISDHLNKAVFSGQKLAQLPIDILFFNEVIGPPAIIDFENNFKSIFRKNHLKPLVFNHKMIFFIPDHTVPSCSVNVSEGIDLMENFAKKHQCQCYKEGDGIEHVVLAEDGYIVPGSIILGTDSHTDTNGAFNTLSFGIGTTDGAYALATGHIYDIETPQTIRFELKGKFNKGVYGKDLILFLIGKMGVDGAVKKVIEFGGPGLKNISISQRATISNMAVEMGARTAIFEFDSILKKYLQKRAKFAYKSYLPDKNCKYEKIIKVDLRTIEPCVAFPHKPSNVFFISQIKKNQKITDAFLGACTNGRYEDFYEAAKILKNRKIHPHVNFVAIPASRKIYNQLLTKGILKIFSSTGVNIESPNCGPCFGKHMGVLGKNSQIISSSNRNYIGRMGSNKAKIFLASPVSVAASAIMGKITDPRRFL